MSRMDVLTQGEIDSINKYSDLVRKYSQTIDRESAYELLTRKIEAIEKQAADETARREWEKGRAGERNRTTTSTRRTTTTAPRRTTTKQRRTTIHPVVKVVTSATFIRGVMGILKKVI